MSPDKKMSQLIKEVLVRTLFVIGLIAAIWALTLTLQDKDRPVTSSENTLK